MRIKGILVIGLLIKLNVFGQPTSVTTDSLTQLLKGNWYVVNSWPATKDTLVFGRISHAPHNWGDRIEIEVNGDIMDAYSAKCGNDERIHKDKGNWTLDKSGSILSSSIPLYLDRPKNRILELTKDRLVLFRLQ